jgi:hypothetical protein
VPPWFNGAMENILAQHLTPIRADLQILKDDVQTLKGDVQTLKGDVHEMKRVQYHIWKLAAKVSNVFPMVLPLIII